nr:hypothetical protein [Tanacetum cinerariifolium]
AVRVGGRKLHVVEPGAVGEKLGERAALHGRDVGPKVSRKHKHPPRPARVNVGGVHRVLHLVEYLAALAGHYLAVHAGIIARQRHALPGLQIQHAQLLTRR